MAGTPSSSSSSLWERAGRWLDALVLRDVPSFSRGFFRSRLDLESYLWLFFFSWVRYPAEGVETINRVTNKRNQIKLSRARRPILTTVKHGKNLHRLMRMNHRCWFFFCNFFSMLLPIFTPFHLLVRRTCLWQILVNFGIAIENIVFCFQWKKNRADIYHIINRSAASIRCSKLKTLICRPQSEHVSPWWQQVSSHVNRGLQLMKRPCRLAEQSYKVLNESRLSLL